MFSSEKYTMRESLYFALGIIAFSLLITLIAFEYGIATFIALSTTSAYYFLFERSIEKVFDTDVTKAAVISIYLTGLLRYILVGGGTVAIFFLFSQNSIRIYTIVIVVIAWFFCVVMGNRR